MSKDTTLDEFTQVQSSKTDTEWHTYSLGELANFHNGRSFDKSEWGDNGYPIIRIQNLTNGKSEFNYFDGELSDKYRVKQNDTLLSWSATIDVFEWDGADAALNQHIFKVETKNSANHTFFRFVLENLLSQLNALSQGSTMKHLRKPDLLNTETDVPPLPEQRKIATVLYTVDRAIEKTREIIEQSERVLEGITQDIFSTGYYNHSEYSNVRLGPVKASVPETWNIKTIPECFKIIDGDRGKNYPSGSDFSDEGYCLFLSAANVTEDGLKFDETEFITQQKDEELRKGKLKRGDVIMTTRGTVGNFGLYDESINYDNIRINSGMVILRPKSNTSHVEYYYRLFRSGIFKRQINATSYGTAQPQTSVTDIKKMGILEPDEDEKRKISELIKDMVSEIQAQKKYRNQLQRIKRGLMQDLLSGTVRTTDTNIQVPDKIT